MSLAEVATRAETSYRPDDALEAAVRAAGLALAVVGGDEEFQTLDDWKRAQVSAAHRALPGNGWHDWPETATGAAARILAAREFLSTTEIHPLDNHAPLHLRIARAALDAACALLPLRFPERFPEGGEARGS